MRISRIIVYLSWILSICLLPVSLARADLLFKKSRLIYPAYSKKISMDFKSANLNDVLKIFSQQSGLNFIVAQEIADKNISLYLDKVPVEQALDRILQANNLTYEIQAGSDIFIVKPLSTPEKTLQTRVYWLKFATVESSKLNTTINIKEGEDATTAPST